MKNLNSINSSGDIVEYLPPVYSTGCLIEFEKFIDKNKITFLYSTNLLVIKYFQENFSSVKIVSSFRELLEERIIQLIADKCELFGFDMNRQGDKNLLSQEILKKIVINAVNTKGQCSIVKLISIMLCLLKTQPGLYLEIGSLYGRSTSLISSITHLMRKGPIVAIDIWDENHNSTQKANPEINKSLYSFHFENIFNEFVNNMLFLSNNFFNYVRKDSIEFLKELKDSYDNNLTYEINSKEFGNLKINSNLSFIFIDGNHDYSQVKNELLLVEPMIQAGTWLVIDDYDWIYSNSVKSATEEFLSRIGKNFKILSNFTIDGALFCQFQ